MFSAKLIHRVVHRGTRAVSICPIEQEVRSPGGASIQSSFIPSWLSAHSLGPEFGDGVQTEDHEGERFSLRARVIFTLSALSLPSNLDNLLR
jgi:hypothetical protein